MQEAMQQVCRTISPVYGDVLICTDILQPPVQRAMGTLRGTPTPSPKPAQDMIPTKRIEKKRRFTTIPSEIWLVRSTQERGWDGHGSFRIKASNAKFPCECITQDLALLVLSISINSFLSANIYWKGRGEESPKHQNALVFICIIIFGAWIVISN